MSSLFKLSNEAAELLTLLRESEGEITPEIEAMIEVNERSLAMKADNYYMLLSAIDGDTSHWEKIRDSLNSYLKSLSGIKKRLRENIKRSMRVQEKSKLDGDTFGFTLSRTKPLLEIDESQLPSEYWAEEFVRKVDKVKIHESIKNGKPVQGVRVIENYGLRTNVKKGMR